MEFPIGLRWVDIDLIPRSSQPCMVYQEIHILHDFGRDFYDELLCIIITGFIRPEYNYSSKGQSSHQIQKSGFVSPFGVPLWN